MPKKVTTKEFIDQARAVHGNKYGYSFSVYKHSKTKVSIHCPEHGMFEQIPNNHLSGNGCPICGVVTGSEQLKSDTNSFVASARKIHGDKYGYTMSVYDGNHNKVTIICPEHGVFEQEPASHLSGSGCPCCANENKKLSTQEFIKKAKTVHGETKYLYDLVDYQNSKKNVTVICTEHGSFQQTPNIHLKGKGCPSCAKTGFDRTKNGFLYVLRSDCGQYMKIGITHNPNKRHAKLKRDTPFSFSCFELLEGKGYYTADLEKKLLRSFQPVFFLENFDGHTEWRLWDSNIINKLRKEKAV